MILAWIVGGLLTVVFIVGLAAGLCLFAGKAWQTLTGKVYFPNDDPMLGEMSVGFVVVGILTVACIFLALIGSRTAGCLGM